MIMFDSKVSTVPFSNPAIFENITEQNKRLIDHLNAGNTINFIEAGEMGITHLSTRITELRAHDIIIYERPLQIQNTRCSEYSLKPYTDDQLPRHRSDKLNAWLKNQAR